MFLERIILVAGRRQEGGVETGGGRPVSRDTRGVQVRTDGQEPGRVQIREEGQVPEESGPRRRVVGADLGVNVGPGLMSVCLSLPAPQTPPRPSPRTETATSFLLWSSASEPSESGPSLALEPCLSGWEVQWLGAACRKGHRFLDCPN